MQRLAHILTMGCLLGAGAVIAAPTHVSGVTMSPEAWRTANEVFAHSVVGDTEAGLCVASGAYRYGIAPDGGMWVEVDRFATTGPQVAQTVQGAKLWLRWRTLCGDTLPSLHTHLVAPAAQASQCDVQGLAQRPRVPFALIQFARDSVALYYVTAGHNAGLLHDTTNYCTTR